MEELTITHTHALTRDIHCIPIGVIYLTNPEYSNITNFNFNQYYVRIIDTVLEQLSISSFYIVPIGLKLSPTPSAAQTVYINEQLNKYPTITRFFCSFPDNFLIVLFEAYFKYNHEKIVFSTGSSGLLVNFQDNVFRFAQNEYPLVNFISNLYFKEPLAFDLIYIPGQFFTGRGAGTTDFIGFDEILTDNKVINEYLATSNRYMIENPLVLTNQPDGMTRNQFVAQMQSTLSNPDYYAPGNNYYQTNIQQYTINFNVINTPSFVSKYGLPAMDVIAWKINNLWIDPQSQVPNVQRMSYIEILCVYLVFFDYTQNKDMVFIITNYNFPVFISAVYYYLPQFAQLYNRPEAFEQFRLKARFVLTGLSNRIEYTYDLFTDPQTDTLWYNYGKTWYETIMFFETRICVQRIDQSMFVLLDKMSRDLNMRSGGKYVDISSTPQPAIIAAYNAVEFLFHFVQNEIDVGPFILSYFNNAQLLQFGDNLVFNSKMDNVYGVILLSYFFYEGTGSIVNRGFNRELTTKCDIRQCGEEYIGPDEKRKSLYVYPVNRVFMTKLEDIKIYNAVTKRYKINNDSTTICSGCVCPNQVQYEPNVKYFDYDTKTEKTEDICFLFTSGYFDGDSRNPIPFKQRAIGPTLPDKTTPLEEITNCSTPYTGI